MRTLLIAMALSPPILAEAYARIVQLGQKPTTIEGPVYVMPRILETETDEPLLLDLKGE